MPAIEIKSPEQYKKALDVLIKVGGTFHGVGGEERTLLVSEAQHEALAAARVVAKKAGKTRGRGKKKTDRNGRV